MTLLLCFLCVYVTFFSILPHSTKVTTYSCTYNLRIAPYEMTFVDLASPLKKKKKNL